MIQHFWCGQHVGQACTDDYLYANLSGFLLIHPNLVLIVSPSFIIVLLSFTACVHVCLMLFLALTLQCSLSFASSSCFVLDCSQAFGVCLVAYATGFFVMLFSISVSGSALAFCCFVERYCMYVSAVTAVSLMWCLLHVMHLPLIVSCIV